MSNYRLHFKKGDIEIQLESTDRRYVDEMFQKLLSAPGTINVEAQVQRKNPIKRPSIGKSTKSAGKEKESGAESTINVATIVNAIHESGKYKDIERNILHARSALARILLACHFAHVSGHDSITTGDVEKITDELGVKIGVSNVSNCIADNRKYFSSSTARQKGAKVLYKLNLQGKKALEVFLSGQKPA